jgi:tRNA 2-thiouridine synthesizing protein D
MATISIGIMDPPYESGNTPTAFRLAQAAIEKGHNVNIFCYEGATGLGFTGQKQHPNAVHGMTLEEEDHPNPKEWIKALLTLAAEKNVKLVWCNCGLCVDERGVESQVDGASRGSPVDWWKFCEASDGVLMIGTQ